MRAVLDTNIVLDWLHFHDPRVARIRDDIAARQLTVLTHSLALDELKRVLAYQGLRIDAPQRAEILSRYLAQTTHLNFEFELTRDRLELPNSFPQCRDPNDQFLLAIAFHGNADLLVTYDKQILKLGKRIARFGLRVVAPKDYKAV